MRMDIPKMWLGKAIHYIDRQGAEHAAVITDVLGNDPNKSTNGAISLAYWNRTGGASLGAYSIPYAKANTHNVNTWHEVEESHAVDPSVKEAEDLKIEADRKAAEQEVLKRKASLEEKIKKDLEEKNGKAEAKSK